MELDAKHDRMMMGMAARLASGKTLNNNTPYGYDNIDGVFVENARQVEAVQLVWQMYAMGKIKRDIRTALVERDLPQVKPTKYTWHTHCINQILKNDCYYTGVCQVKWDGEIYEIPAPVIIDPETAKQVRNRQASYKRYPSGNLKAHALAAGLVFCEACNRLMHVVAVSKGEGSIYKYLYYRCHNADCHMSLPGCARVMRARKLDDELWKKVWGVIEDPAKFEAAIQEQITKLQSQDFDATAECERLQRELDAVAMERQIVITGWRKGKISEADLDLQLGALSIQEAGLRQELGDKSLLIGDRAARLRELAQMYREDVYNGAVLLASEPQTDEERQAQFEFRRKIVQGIVKRIDVTPDKLLRVHVELAFEPADLPAGVLCINEAAGCRQRDSPPRAR